MRLWMTILPVVLLCGTGLGVLYSASATLPAGTFRMQIFWFVFGVAAAVVTALMGHRVLARLAWPAFLFNIALLVVVLLFGRRIGGAHRWIELLGFRFQPSETMKLLLILTLARHLHSLRNVEGLGLWGLRVPLALVGLPAVLVLVEPDLGTAILLSVVAGTVILSSGVKGKTLLLVVAIGAGVTVPTWKYLLRGYQRKRIAAFLDPARQKRGAGYHVIQSAYAVGSGRVWGKGYLQGTQSQLRWVPAKHTDFVLAVLAEEWGFVGVVVVMGLYAWLLLAGLSAAERAQDGVGRLVGIGVVALLFWQTAFNAGMVLGLLPVVGLPLPFFSKGGSSLVVTLAASGLLVSVAWQRRRR